MYISFYNCEYMYILGESKLSAPSPLPLVWFYAETHCSNDIVDNENCNENNCRFDTTVIENRITGNEYLKKEEEKIYSENPSRNIKRTQFNKAWNHLLTFPGNEYVIVFIVSAKNDMNIFSVTLVHWHSAFHFIFSIYDLISKSQIKRHDIILACMRRKWK